MAVIEHEPQTRPLEAPARIVDRDAHRALQELLRVGWCQGHYCIPDAGLMCIAGSIFKATEDDDDPFAGERLYRRVRDSLGLEEEPADDQHVVCDMSLENWNDDPERTPEEVYEALERVAHGV